MISSIEQHPVAALTCPSCSNTSNGSYCSECGERLHPQRFNLKRIIQSIPDIFFDVEHGLLFSIIGLLKNPAVTISSFLKGDRARHYKPLKFLLFMCGLYALLFISYKINGSSNPQYEGVFKHETAVFMDEMVNQYQSIIHVIGLPVLSLITWLLFGTRRFYYGEHLVINAFVIGMIVFIQIVLFPLFLWKNGTSWVDTLYMLSALFTLYFCTRTFYGLFYTPGKSNLLTCFFKTIGVIVLYTLWNYITNPIIIYTKIALLGS